MSESIQSNTLSSSAVSNTFISVSKDHAKPIQEFAVGDLVLAADSAALKTWTQKPVKFAMGLVEGQIRIVRIFFGDENKKTKDLAVTMDQLFLMRDGKLKKASTLIPHSDQLIQADGTTVAIQSMSIETFYQGINDIATSGSPAKSLDGHLLLANGIVIGDYALQLGYRADQ